MSLNLIGESSSESESSEEQPEDFKLNGRFSVQDLHYNNLLKDLQIKKIYEKITDDLFRKIERANETIKRDFTEFKVPYNYMGAKDYNFSECLCHIIFTLRKAGFYVRYQAPNSLFICWPDYEKLEKERRKIKFLEYEHKKSQALLQLEGTLRPKAKDVHKQLQANPHASENGADLLSLINNNKKNNNILMLPGPNE